MEGAQNFALFVFPSAAANFAHSSLRGLFVEWWSRLKGPPKVRVWCSLGSLSRGGSGPAKGRVQARTEREKKERHKDTSLPVSPDVVIVLWVVCAK